MLKSGVAGQVSVNVALLERSAGPSGIRRARLIVDVLSPAGEDQVHSSHAWRALPASLVPLSCAPRRKTHNKEKIPTEIIGFRRCGSSCFFPRLVFGYEGTAERAKKSSIVTDCSSFVYHNATCRKRAWPAPTCGLEIDVYTLVIAYIRVL
jgi:hypothetical protein